MNLNNWSEDDLEDLDAKFDALCEHLGVEFVFERVSDGSTTADRSRVYVRQNRMMPRISHEIEPPRYQKSKQGGKSLT